jgi:hypothetical protein
VTAGGSSNANKVWKCDSGGNPGWRDDSNTTYAVFTGASSSNDGSSGLVPKPLKADRTKFLKGDGTWATVSTSDTKVKVTTTNSGNAASLYPILLAYNATSASGFTSGE